MYYDIAQRSVMRTRYQSNETVELDSMRLISVSEMSTLFSNIIKKYIDLKLSTNIHLNTLEE